MTGQRITNLRHKKKGAAEAAPILARWLTDELELEPDADAEVERRLVLWGRAAQQRVDRFAEVQVRRAGAELRVLVVAGDAALVEQVERLGHERQTARAGDLHRPCGLQIELALARRPFPEAVDRLDARSTSSDGDFTRAVVVGV